MGDVFGRVCGEMWEAGDGRGRRGTGTGWGCGKLADEWKGWLVGSCGADGGGGGESAWKQTLEILGVGDNHQ